MRPIGSNNGGQPWRICEPLAKIHVSILHNLPCDVVILNGSVLIICSSKYIVTVKLLLKVLRNKLNNWILIFLILRKMMKNRGVKDEWRTCSSKEDRCVAVNFDWFVWVAIFKSQKANIVPILFNDFDSHESVLNVSNKGLLVTSEARMIVFNDLRRQGLVYKQSFRETWPALAANTTRMGVVLLSGRRTKKWLR